MKKAVLSFFVLLVLVAGPLLAGPVIISPQAVSEKLSQKIESITGKSVRFDETVEITYSPYLGISISNLTVYNQNDSAVDTPVLSVENLSSQISFLQMLMGSIELGDLTLERPKLNLQIQSNGFKNWSLNEGQLSSSIRASRENIANSAAVEIPKMNLGSLIIKDGIIKYVDTIDGTQQTFSSINGRIDWPDIVSPAQINANAIWRGETFLLNTEINNALSFIAGGETGLELQIESQPLTMNFDGIANTLADLFIAGDLQATTPSIQRFGQIFEIHTGELGTIQNWSTTGKLEASAKQMKLSEGSFKIGSKTANGVIQINQMSETVNKKLAGTLAFETIDLPDYPKQLGQKSDIKPFDLDNVDIDLRISAQTLNLGTVSFENVAASVLANDNEWSFDIGNSNAFGGVMTAKIGQTPGDDANRSILNAKADQIAVEALLNQFGEAPYSISGIADIQANLRTTSPNEEPLNYAANGEIEGTIRSGRLAGVDIIQLLEKSSGNAPLVFNGLDQNTQTPFDTLNFKLFINNGVATLARTTLASGDGMIQLSGEINFLEGILTLQAQAMQDGAPMPERLVLSGSLNDLKAEVKRQTPSSN